MIYDKATCCCVSDVMNGKRVISKLHAKALGKPFHISPEVFI
jgi:antitoxin component HigA of HigAB toxin-antitoxin module